jgi:hypothetical protein
MSSRTYGARANLPISPADSGPAGFITCYVVSVAVLPRAFGLALSGAVLA